MARANTNLLAVGVAVEEDVVVDIKDPKKLQKKFNKNRK